MEKVDMQLWERKEIFDFFSGMSQPFYSVTFTVDVTELYKHVKAHGLSFYYALVYLCTEAVNETDAFLYMMKGGEVYKIDRREPSFTDIKPESEQFYIVTMPGGNGLDEFCHDARKRSREQKAFIDAGQETGDLIYFTCLPWVELTALTNERAFDPDDTVPRIAWGKYRDEDGVKRLQMSLELNHRFLDGIHIGKFYETLCRKMSQCGT